MEKRKKEKQSEYGKQQGQDGEGWDTLGLWHSYE